MARLLITGASGFIGGFIVEQALQKGHEVVAAIRNNSNTSRLRDPRLQLLTLDLQHKDSMVAALQEVGRFDWVIHNAGVTKALDRSAYFAGNTDNTLRLIQALQEPDLLPEKFLLVSSLAALGAAPGTAERITSAQKPAPLTAYGASKLGAENSLPHHFPWIAVQPTAVYGPWERDILTFIRLMQKGLELTIGRHSQRLSFIHAADTAGAILKILASDGVLHRKFILSDGRDYQTEDLGDAVRQALGKKTTLRLKLPLGVVSQIAHISETIGRWQKKPSPLNRDKLAELAAPNWHCDASALIREIQYQPQFDLYTGMKDTIDWYRTNEWL